ncbi:hypothetical protein [Haloechinothrix salitolerans]|uniref:Tetratricopeptide repeat-containing protein n=1 Tax=Haloechinothrix salitolerans TaxID=926830 RepID=A0ABW2C8V2_9PSEU
MESARDELARLRQNRSGWQELRYDEAVGADGYAYDTAMARRAKVLWALQYDRRADDHDLLRHIAEQEAVCRRKAPLAGLSDEARLAGFLLAEHGEIEDVWTQWAIKRANFDTTTGYDVEHLLAAGVAATIEYVRASDHEDKDALLKQVLDRRGEPIVTEDELAAWFERKSRQFPTDPDAEDPMTWVERARLVGDVDAARDYLARWADGRARDQSTLSQLRYHQSAVGDYAAAAQTQEEYLSLLGTPRDLAVNWCTLAEFRRRAGQYEAALAALRQCGRVIVDVPNWEQYAMGRTYVKELVLLALAADVQLASAVFAEADGVASAVPRLPATMLAATAEAAERTGHHLRAEHYRERLAEEQRQAGSETDRSRG